MKYKTISNGGNKLTALHRPVGSTDRKKWFSKTWDTS